MSFARYAPLSIIATLGVAFASACGDEKSVADAAAATITVTPDPIGPLDARAASAGPGAVTVYQWRRVDLAAAEVS